MKKLFVLAALCSLGLFTIGCGETTVTTEPTVEPTTEAHGEHGEGMPEEGHGTEVAPVEGEGTAVPVEGEGTPAPVEGEAPAPAEPTEAPAE
jgi:hypothetical protein